MKYALLVKAASRPTLLHYTVCCIISGLSLQWANAEETHQAEASNAPITSLAVLSSLRDIPPPSSNIKTPKIEAFSTKVGTPTLFVAAPELPIVDIRLTFDAGSARDAELRAGLFGLASLTSQLLDEGTSTQTTDEIAKRFESLGAEYSASSYRDMFTVNLRVLADPAYLNPAIEQLLAILKDAQFPQSSINRVFNSAALGQQQRKESPSAVVGIRFFRELYGQHPYAEPSTGTEASLKKITPQDIRNFKDTYLVANNLNIAITGQLTLAQAQQLANQISNNLPKGQKARTLPAPVPLQAARTVVVPFNSTQSHVIIGQIGTTRVNPDNYALTVGNEMLGGDGFNALLMKELREKRGLTYGAYSGFTTMRTNGPFMINYSTRGDQALQSIQVAKQTLNNFLANPLDQQLLTETREGMLNSFPLSLASNESILGYLAMIGFYQLPTTYLADYPKQIAAVTSQDISQAMHKYIQPDKMLTIVVGQPFDSNALNAPIAPATPASQPAEPKAAVNPEPSNPEQLSPEQVNPGNTSVNSPSADKTTPAQNASPMMPVSIKLTTAPDPAPIATPSTPATHP